MKYLFVLLILCSCGQEYPMVSMYEPPIEITNNEVHDTVNYIYYDIEENYIVKHYKKRKHHGHRHGGK
jgi:hypothetical protein